MSDVSQGPGWSQAADEQVQPQQAEAPTVGAESKLHKVAKSESIKKGLHAALGALETSGIAKVDRQSGEVKIKKFGVARAALRPTKTIRKAINGATTDFVRNDKPPEGPPSRG